MAEEGIHKRGLAVVNVGDDGDVAKLFVTGEFFQECILMDGPDGTSRKKGRVIPDGIGICTPFGSGPQVAVLLRPLAEGCGARRLYGTFSGFHGREPSVWDVESYRGARFSEDRYLIIASLRFIECPP